MDRFTPHNTIEGEKYLTLDGAISGTVISCRFCPHARTDLVLVWGWRGKHIQFEVKAETIKRGVKLRGPNTTRRG